MKSTVLEKEKQVMDMLGDDELLERIDVLIRQEIRAVDKAHARHLMAKCNRFWKEWYKRKANHD